MTPSIDTPRMRPLADICIAVIAAAFVAGWVNAGWISEGGALEVASVVGLVLTAGVLAYRLPSLAFGPEWHLPVLSMLLAMRELDFDKRFVEDGFLKLRLYTGDGPILTKLIGATLILLILVCLYRLVRHNGRSYVDALRRREGWAIAVAVGVLAVVVAKSIDGLPRKLGSLGVTFDATYGPFVVMMEEGLEFCFTAALLLSVFLWIRRHA